jgi:hypothetical protein
MATDQVLRATKMWRSRAPGEVRIVFELESGGEQQVALPPEAFEDFKKQLDRKTHPIGGAGQVKKRP